MKKLGAFKIVSIITIIFLLCGCIYFYNKSEMESKKPNNRITIGTYTDAGTIDFSEPINSIDDANFIQFAIMGAISIDKTTDKIPNNAIWIADKTRGIVYLTMDVWIENNKVIFGKYADKHQFKEIDSKYAQELIKRISTNKNKHQ